VGREEVEDSCTRVDRRCNALMRLNLFVIQEFIAKAITLPGEGEIMDMMEVADPDAVHAVRSFIRKQLASELKAEFLRTVRPVTLGLLYLYLMSPLLD
jgi:aminopeptidase N